MTNGEFYLLEGLSETQTDAFFCQRIAELWRQYRSLRVWCQDEAQALHLDELLWQQPTDAFVPHNLVGEGPPGGAPVELCWSQAAITPRRVAAHFNLMTSPLEQWQGAKLIADVVPQNESGKAQARERYKHYRQAGVALRTLPAQELFND